MKIAKTHAVTAAVLPFEQARITLARPAARLHVRDGQGRLYVDTPPAAGRTVRFTVRGAAGRHVAQALDAAGHLLEEAAFRLAPRTNLACDAGPYARMFAALENMIATDHETRPWIINGRKYQMLVCWSRDHVYTLKAARHFIADVKSGLDYWLDSQKPDGMFWDCIHPNTGAPAPSWLGEALGEGWYRYDDGMKYVVRRVPVLADTEYVFTEGVWLAWKASGDDGWLARQVPRLEKALHYLTHDPLRWSSKEGLVRRSFTADEWDFANPHYCAGDHRCIHPGDPAFLFHGNNSGLYAMMLRLAEMHEHLGDAARAASLRHEAEALRRRANARLFFDTHYGHMIPETLDPERVYALVGDERERMSLSTGYTINRGLPTHEMAVKIIREYQRRGQAKRDESFAEWWTMDPPYTPDQWPGQESNTAGCPVGEYMNGGICPIVAGEIAKAAFEHGCETYGVDILDRVWRLIRRDGGHLHQVYRRLPEKTRLPRTRFRSVDLRPLANRGLRHGATPGVIAWTGEGDNDLRNLPTGRQRLANIPFDIIAPQRNGGRAVVCLDGDPARGAPRAVVVPLNGRSCRSIYFLHALGRSGGGAGSVAGYYDAEYADGRTERIHVRDRREIGLWWGIDDHGMNRDVARRAWWGANPQWKTVGLFAFGWNNPRPDTPLTALRLAAADERAGILLAGLTLSDQPVAFEPRIRSYGLPDCWAQAAVYHALAEGLAGIEDRGAAFSAVRIAPRWSATRATRAAATLHYPASDGYCSYALRLDRRRRTLTLDVSGSFARAELHCLLPAGPARRVTCGGRDIAFRNTLVEQSRYVDFTLEGLPTQPVEIEY